MRKNGFHPTHVRKVHLLRDYLSQVNARMRHLHSLVGSQIGGSDRALSRIAGGDPVDNTVHSRLDEDSLFSSEHLAAAFLNSAKQTLTSKSAFSAYTSGNNDPGFSSGQIMADIAKEITRAMRRNL